MAQSSSGAASFSGAGVVERSIEGELPWVGVGPAVCAHPAAGRHRTNSATGVASLIVSIMPVDAETDPVQADAAVELIEIMFSHRT